METYKYNINKYNFSKLVSSTFGVSDLNNIHNSNEFSYDYVFERKNDQSTHWHSKFYKLARTEEFKSMYTSFIDTVVKPLYDNQIVYQTIPTFRLQFPNNIAVGEYHRDRDYRDGAWANEVKELNFFLPITDAFSTNTIWVESSDGLEDYTPMNVKYGEFVRWDGSNLKHGNKVNQENVTRISMDFRVIDYKNYIPSDKGSINVNTQFKIGGYYSIL